MDRLQSLAVFQRVCEAQSFTKAAASLNLPRSTVTQAVQRLESQLRVPLLVRTTRQVNLTREGEALLAKARQLLADWDELEALFQPQAQPGGILRIDLPSRLARLVVIPALPGFHDAYPQIQLHIGISDKPIDLVQEGVDAVLRAGPLQDSNLVARRLGEIPLVTVASPGYLARFGTPQHPEQLDGHQMVGYASPSSGRIDPFEYHDGSQYCHRMLPHPITTNGADAYMAAALAGLGLAQCPSYDARRHLVSGHLQELLAAYPPKPMPLAILFPQRGQLSRRVQLFADWLAGQLRAQAVTQVQK
ncbi:LysR family transcriptional regulator [Gallaecimonas kandeliae]|uniref:LysR family transcriptional regulator n=1 Tax=Gallaecimonas kandeliae TaxID=3029055 RepID=UPI002647C093|nr:LysR family transcriptional regulator [Gallaecimonas kandeliae]WKE65019.1 LysR family transcriptional regulator [Gallaecimonas kandeliae]